MSPRVRSILAEVAKEHGVTVAQLEADDRRRVVAFARYDAMARLRALHTAPGHHRFSLPQIGTMLGGRDHTMVIYGLKRAAEVFGPRAPVYPVLDSEETRL